MGVVTLAAKTQHERPVSQKLSCLTKVPRFVTVMYCVGCRRTRTMTDVAAASAQVRASSSGLHTSSGLADNPAPSLQYPTALGLPSGPSHPSTLLSTSLSPIRHAAYGDFGESDSLMAQHFLGSPISSNPTGSLPFALSTQLTNPFPSASQRGSMPPTMAPGSQQQQRRQIVDNALQQQLPWQ